MTQTTAALKQTRLPLVGFGTYLIDNDLAEEVSYQALKTGYRHIDTAQGYANEEGIGRAIDRAIAENLLQRHELSITTKLWPGNEAWGQKPKDFDQSIQACETSLNKLQLDYLDLYLIHAPFAVAHRIEQWQALLELQQRGLVKDIGVCNYNIKHFEEIKSQGLPLPAANQIELHPWTQKPELMDYMQEHNIQAIAYSSLVPLSNWREQPGEDSAKTEAMKQEGSMSDSPFKTMAKEHGVSEAQILLKWAVQKGIPVIPKSIQSDRIKQNFDLFSFELSHDNLHTLDQQDKGSGVAWTSGDPCDFQQ